MNQSLCPKAKSMNFENDIQLFDEIINNYYNGFLSLNEAIIKDMRKSDCKRFLDYLTGCFDHPASHNVYNYLSSLIKSK